MESEPRPGTASRKQTLAYDLDFPKQPPRLASFGRDANAFSGLGIAFSANLAVAKDVRGSEQERASVRETSEFSGFDGDLLGNVENVEDEREMRQDRRGAQRETIGAAL